MQRFVWLVICLMLVSCGSRAQARPTAVPTVTEEATEEPTPVAMPLPTEEPEPTAEPTPAGPRTTDPAGVPPLNKDDCPEDYPIKGNIRDDGGKLYHEPSFRSYAATDPEICFALVEDADKAGFQRPASQ